MSKSDKELEDLKKTMAESERNAQMMVQRISFQRSQAMDQIAALEVEVLTLREKIKQLEEPKT